MQITKIKGQRRQAGNRHTNERLRREGLVPAVIYGHGEAPETVSLSLHDLLLALERAQHVVEVGADDKTERYLVKDVQYDHLQKTPIHVDLMRVDVHERVKVKVRIHLRGTPQGVAAEGGELVQVLAELEIEASLLEIPESIQVNVAALTLGSALNVGSLELPAGVTTTAKPEDIVAVVRLKKAEEEVAPAAAAPAAAEGAAAAQPEVIGRVAKEEAEGEAGA